MANITCSADANDQLQDILLSVVAVVWQARNQSQPVNRFPPEILVHIYQCLSPSSSYPTTVQYRWDAHPVLLLSHLSLPPGVSTQLGVGSWDSDDIGPLLTFLPLREPTSLALLGRDIFQGFMATTKSQGFCIWYDVDIPYLTYAKYPKLSALESSFAHVRDLWIVEEWDRSEGRFEDTSLILRTTPNVTSLPVNSKRFAQLLRWLRKLFRNRGKTGDNPPLLPSLKHTSQPHEQH
ncbi:hypothetical protein CERSUDRAFT_94926 [Gelatoporia subvermispora B]|uniref:Uncharacterized protein n=1 Tax=Ceriporiopsis subvermispora (strain B) TaxID=914234 RepID=M2PK48_CERS8|nr:hypothetical protein CERSUDRAFT_94926 [Gelatoporia subvermispora B]